MNTQGGSKASIATALKGKTAMGSQATHEAFAAGSFALIF